jgi:hypothetical protein
VLYGITCKAMQLLNKIIENFAGFYDHSIVLASKIIFVWLLVFNISQ